MMMMMTTMMMMMAVAVTTMMVMMMVTMMMMMMVVLVVKESVLAYFGLPSILHTDNRPDLNVKGLKELVVDWPGDDDDDNNDDDDGRGSDHDDGDIDDDNDGRESAGLLPSALHPPHQQLPQPQRQGAERAGGGLAR